LKYASTSIAVPSLLGVTTVAGENRGSCAISCLRVVMALCVALLETSPVTTILAGSVTPPENSFSSVMKPFFEGKSSESWLTVWEVPRFSWK